MDNLCKFQSTLSLRRATTADAMWFLTQVIFQSTLSLRRATAHSLDGICAVRFQSTLSLRRATGQFCRRRRHHSISIHALLAESDFSHRESGQNYINFNPRSPCGERRQTIRAAMSAMQFQSTLSLRRATRFTGVIQSRALISIHALLAESDHRLTAASRRERNFNPRSPCGERRWWCRDVFSRSPISIHALLAESDVSDVDDLPPLARFQSTLSLRRATVESLCGLLAGEFQSTLSLRRATANTTKLALSFLSKVPI